MLSNMVARADVRDATQRQALETYLLGEQRTAAELAAFASVFPNANFHISNNLLTHAPYLDGAALAERDRAAWVTVNAWLADPRFETVTGTLRMVQSRLRQFVKP